MRMIVLLLLLPLACASAGDNLPPAAFAPAVEESRARLANAAARLAESQKRQSALAADLKRVEAGIFAMEKRLPASPDAAAMANRLTAAEARVLELRERLEAGAPATFTQSAQFLARDRLADELKSLEASLPTLREQRIAMTLARVAGTPEGAALAARRIELHREWIAVSNETELRQSARDDVFRIEAGVMRQLSTPAAAPAGTETRLRPAPPADSVERMRAFRARRSPEAVGELARRFFAGVDLTLPGMETVRAELDAGRPAQALDAWKHRFLAGLAKPVVVAENTDEESEPQDGAATLSEVLFSPPADWQLADALAGVVRQGLTLRGKSMVLAVELGEPGTIPWRFADSLPNPTGQDDPLPLAVCRRMGEPGHPAEALLRSYALGGPREHLQRWADTVDDWALHWQRDAEASPLALRDYNLLVVCRLQAWRERLRLMLRLRPELADDLPADTLARWWMVMNEEYLAAAWRLGRSGLYNFRIMALKSMLPTSLEMREFHAHRRAVREGWRQVDNNFVYKIRRDGANFEFANDGHENTDQALIRTFAALRDSPAQPDGLEPFWQEEFLDNFLANTRYWVHNLKPDGMSYRLNARSQRKRYLGDDPEYKVNLLAGEDELRRRVWKVHRVGKPEDEPRIDSEMLAYQGYAYLRSGWEPGDEFIYFQTIGQPILSGREDNTAFSWHGQGGTHLLHPALTVDGRTQNIHAGLVENPGGKAPFAAYGKPDAVKTGRFHAGREFDLVEGRFEGVHQYPRPSAAYHVFGEYGWESARAKAESQARREGREFRDDPIGDVTHDRRLIKVRGTGMLIVTDRVRSAEPHRFTQHQTMFTPVRADAPSARLQAFARENLTPFVLDEAERWMSTRNPGLPNLGIRHFTSLGLQYQARPDTRRAAVQEGGEAAAAALKKFGKRERQVGEARGTVEFAERPEVSWTGQGDQVMVTVMRATKPDYETVSAVTVLEDARPLGGSASITGFTGAVPGGQRLAYLAAAAEAELDLGPVRATGTALLLHGDDGLALDCRQLSAGGVTLRPEAPDFVFRLRGGKPEMIEPIHRPIAPLRMEPTVNVFTSRVEVTLACPTPGVEIRYTLDGSRPTPASPRYERALVLTGTTRVKARAFRPGLTEDVWTQDGTHATAVFSGIYRREEPAPSRVQESTQPGLRFTRVEGPWTTLMTALSSLPATSTGSVDRVLEPSSTPVTGPYALRLDGWIRVPADGVYTFHAPAECLYPDNDCGYDLRVFVNEREWNPAVRWQGHGNWSVALSRGAHRFRVEFADLRHRPHKVELMWGFPHPDFTWKGGVPQLLVSGPGMPPQPIPAAMLRH